MEQPACAVTSPNPELFEIDHVVRPWTHRCGLVEGSVRAVIVVVTLVFAQQPDQVLQVLDEGAVGQLRA